MRPLALAGAWLALLATPALGQGDPIMPLEDVRRGMKCEGRSVVRGTEIVRFDVEILDVIAAGGGSPPGILFRASGPAIDATGLGFGFSGSPIYCPGSDGVQRNAGAVAAGVEDHGNDVALATPIESILELPVATPAGARPPTAAERRARPYASPLFAAGIGRPVRDALAAAAARRGIALLGAPATAAQVSTGVDLQPGSAVAAGVATGAIGLSGIGTVAYRDGARVWAFGHALDDAGPRSLLLQGAFVHHVVGNPDPPGFSGLGTYKLASAGNVAGTVDFDGSASITGLMGPPPATIPVVVRATGPGGERLPKSVTHVADESPLNYPGGFPPLSLVASIAVADSALKALRSNAGASHGRLCSRVDLAQRTKPLRFCNRYVGTNASPGGTQAAMSADVMAAAALVEAFDRSQLTVERFRSTLERGYGDRFARLRSASGPRRIRPGRRIRIRLRVQRSRRPVERLSFTMRVPRNLRPGRRTLRLTGAQADPDGSGMLGLFGLVLGEGDPGGGGLDGDQAPATLAELAEAVGDVHRYDGIRGTFRRRSEAEGEELSELEQLFGSETPESGGRALYRHPELRIGGRAKIRFRVLPR